MLGYPDQALKRMHEALTLARELSHPFSLAFALLVAAVLRQLRREEHEAKEGREAIITLSSEQGFPHWLAWGTIVQGWALAGQCQEEGITRIRQGLANYQATGAALFRPHHLALLTEAYGGGGQAEEGLSVLAEALTQVDNTGERWCEADLYRLKGELTLQEANQKSKSKGQKSENPNPNTQILDLQSEAEACFLKAIEIAQRQQAKSWELRATMSLVRLRQQQAIQHGSRTADHAPRPRLDEAHRMLVEIYNWFTEGFETRDLQEAKALAESLELSV